MSKLTKKEQDLLDEITRQVGLEEWDKAHKKWAEKIEKEIEESINLAKKRKREAEARHNNQVREERERKRVEALRQEGRNSTGALLSSRLSWRTRRDKVEDISQFISPPSNSTARQRKKEIEIINLISPSSK